MIWGPGYPRKHSSRPLHPNHQAARWRSWMQRRASYLISQSATASRKWDAQQWYRHRHSSVKSRWLNYHAVTQRLAAGVDLLDCCHHTSWKNGGGRCFIWWKTSHGLARNLHISNHKCVFVSEAAPLFYCTNLLPLSGAGKKMEEGATETERQCETERNKGRKREQERGVYGEM